MKLSGVTANDMQDLIVNTLARDMGGTRRRWRIAVGPVRVRGADTHRHRNWTVEPAGSWQQNATIENLLDDLRLQFPILHDV